MIQAATRLCRLVIVMLAALFPAVSAAQDIDTLAGSGSEGYTGDGGPATSAETRKPYGIAIAQNGDLFIADYTNEVVRKVARSTGDISTFAGGGSPTDVGEGVPAIHAFLENPHAVTADASGNIYIADTDHHRIRKVAAGTGTITTIAGTGTGGYSGDGGPGTSAMIKNPRGIAVDSAGNVIFSDSENHRVRKITPGGTISTVAGNGSGGFEGDGGPATAAKVKKPAGLFIDGDDYVYVADTDNNRIRKFTLGGTITTIAGEGGAGFSEGDATLAKLNAPRGVWVVDNGGSDDWGHETAFASTQTLVTDKQIATQVTLAEDATVTGITAYVGGPNKKVRYAIYSDAAGEPDLLLAETQEAQKPTGSLWFTIGLPDTALTVGTYWLTLCFEDDAESYAYSPTGGATRYSDQNAVGDGFTALWGPTTTTNAQRVSIYATYNGNHVYVADTDNKRIRRFTEGGTIITIAGDGGGGYSGDGGPATAAELNKPDSVALDAAGNVFIGDTENHRIRVVDAVTGDIDTYGGTGTAGNSGDGGPATAAMMDLPKGVFVDSAGDLLLIDSNSHVLRKIAAATGTITRVAGTPGEVSGPGDWGLASNAYLSEVRDVAFDSQGNLYIACSTQCRIRKVDATFNTITTVAGTGVSGYGGDGGLATSALLKKPSAVALDSAGNIYIADTENYRIRKVDAVFGTIETIAGNGSSGYEGDGGPATLAKIKKVWALDVDSAGNVYIADAESHRIRKVDAATGFITTVAGNGSGGYEGDGGTATAAKLKNPWGVAVASGKIYIADSGNNRIRMVDAAGDIDTIAGNGDSGFAGDGGPATAAELDKPFVVELKRRDLYIGDTDNVRIRWIDGPSPRVVSWQETEPQ